MVVFILTIPAYIISEILYTIDTIVNNIGTGVNLTNFRNAQSSIQTNPTPANVLNQLRNIRALLPNHGDIYIIYQLMNTVAPYLSKQP